MSIQRLTRVFKKGPTRLLDPDPAMTPEQVLEHYTDLYPELANATVSDPEASATELVYTFEKPMVKTKGNGLIDARCRPSPSHRFFLFDPDEGLSFYPSAESRDAAVAETIESFLDEAWREEVTDIVVGEVTGHTVARGVQKRPTQDEGESDEDFEERESEWPNADVEYICRYEIAPLDDPGESTP